MNSIEWLAAWFEAQCNGEWEHSKGIRITTLDNPGWMLTVDLAGTPFEESARDGDLVSTGEPPSSLHGNVGGRHWMKCYFVNRQFVGAGDPGQLEAIVVHFRNWVAAHEKAST